MNEKNILELVGKFIGKDFIKFANYLQNKLRKLFNIPDKVTVVEIDHFRDILINWTQKTTKIINKSPKYVNCRCVLIGLENGDKL